MSDDLEAKARSEGWKPEEEFVADGKPAEQWVDAATFLERGKNINAILRKNNQRLEREVAELKAEITNTGKSIKELQAYNARIEQMAYDRAIRDLKQEKRAAIAAGEHEAAADLDDQIEELRAKPPVPPKEEKTEEKKPDQPQLDPMIAEWVEENSDWFNDDNPDLVGYANGVGRKLQATKPNLKGKAFLKEVKDAVQKAFPSHFGLEEGERGGVVDDGGTPSRRTTPSGSTLPADARKERDKLCKEQWYINLAKTKGITPQKMFENDYFGSN